MSSPTSFVNTNLFDSVINGSLGTSAFDTGVNPKIYPTIAPSNMDQLLQDGSNIQTIVRLVFLIFLIWLGAVLILFLYRSHKATTNRMVFNLKRSIKSVFFRLAPVIKKVKRINFLYPLIVGLIIIGIINLVTPDKSKILYQRNLQTWWNRVKPKTANSYVTINFICPVDNTNPEYTKYYQSSFSTCKDLRELKQVKGTPFDYSGYPDTDEYLSCMKKELHNAPDKYIKVDVLCPKPVINGKWFYIGGIKLWKVTN